MEIFFKFALNTIYKRLKFSKKILEKNFKL